MAARVRRWSSYKDRSACDLTFAFYNVGWNAGSRKHHEQRLAREVCDMVRSRNIDAVGLCEVFSLLPQEDLRQRQKDQRRKYIMGYLLQTLNRAQAGSSTGRSTLPTAMVWEGRVDGHYIFLWNSSKLHLHKYEYISCGVDQQDWRMAQYFRFKHPSGGDLPTLHVCHNHSPSSEKAKLTPQRKKTIASTLLEQVIAKSDTPKPMVILGGDFNCNDAEWKLCLAEAESKLAKQQLAGSMPRIQVCTSEADADMVGDRALVLNGWAFQQPSGWGKSWCPYAFSDAHDAVLVTMPWPPPSPAGPSPHAPEGTCHAYLLPSPATGSASTQPNKRHCTGRRRCAAQMGRTGGPNGQVATRPH